MKNKWKKTIGIGLILGTALCLSGCGSTTINMNDYLEYEIGGYEGYGTISSHVNTQSAMSDYEDEIAGLDDGAEDAAVLAALDSYRLMERIDGEWSQTDSLSNGDTVTFTWDEDAIQDFEDSCDVKIKYSDVKVTIEGLEEVATYDAFTGLEVTYGSLDPFGTVSLNSEDCEISNLTYTAEPSTGLKNGDTITVTVEVPDNCAQQYGKVPEDATKTYKVEGLSGFVTSAADIPEDTMAAMKKQAEDVKKSRFENSKTDGESLNSITYLGNYFLTMKDDEAKNHEFSLSPYSTPYNALYLIYEVNLTNEEGSYPYYWYCEFKNITFLEDGTCSVDTSNYTVPSSGILSSETVRLGDRSYSGFKDKESLFNKCVTQNAASYNYEDNWTSKQNTDDSATKTTEQEGSAAES